MFLRQVSIEIRKPVKHLALWSGLAALLLLLALFIVVHHSQILRLANFYKTNQPELLNGPLKMPGASFDLANLSYIALTLIFVFALRSTFVSVVLGLGYTQILEFLLAEIFHRAGWTNWLFTNLHFGANFLLNTTGNRVSEIPSSIFTRARALAIWFNRHRDVGG
jgi:hypothetical protein